MPSTFDIIGGDGGTTANARAATGGGGESVARQTSFCQGGFAESVPANESGGGALVLIAGGDITINGQIKCRGSRGGNGGDSGACGTTGAESGSGGGGSGGGKVVVIRRGAYSFAGQYLLTGGTGGQPGQPDGANISGQAGSNGQDGSVSTYQL